MIRLNYVIVDSLSQKERLSFFKGKPDATFCFDTINDAFEAIERIQGYSEYTSFEIATKCDEDVPSLVYLGMYL